MAPNKFEQHIKEELNRREIEPSASAWEKISNGLDGSQKQRKPKYLWIGIAASFAGLLIISTIYFNYDKADIDNTNPVVNTNTENVKRIENKTDTMMDKVEKEQIVNTAIIKQIKPKILDQNSDIKFEKTNNLPQKYKITEVAIVNPQLEIVTKKDFNQEQLLQQKIAEVIAKVENLEQNNKMLTDLEVDSLILQAQREILQNKIFLQNQSVDAMALLSEVEDELDKPLKEQLFDLLKKGIYETRNVIADRN